MGYMKELDTRIRSGGDDAIAAACELAGLAKERRGYEEMKNATGDITDIVTVLRGVGFATVEPTAGDSASLLHYCVTHAADEIERLRRQVSSQKNLTLTDEERAAVALAMHRCEGPEFRTLRALLERTK